MPKLINHWPVLREKVELGKHTQENIQEKKHGNLFSLGNKIQKVYMRVHFHVHERTYESKYSQE